MKKNELEKDYQNNKNTTACKQSKTNNHGKNNKEKTTGRPKPKAPSSCIHPRAHACFLGRTTLFAELVWVGSLYYYSTIKL